MKTYRPTPPVDPNTFGESDINDKFYYGFQNQSGKGIVTVSDEGDSYEIIHSAKLLKASDGCLCWERSLAALFEKATRVLENKIYQFTRQQDFYSWLSNDRTPAFGSVKYFVSEDRIQKDNLTFFGDNDITEGKFYGLLYAKKKYVFKKNAEQGYYPASFSSLFSIMGNTSSRFSLKEIIKLNVSESGKIFQFDTEKDLEQWFCYGVIVKNLSTIL